LNRKNVLILVFSACVAVFSWAGHAEEKKTEAHKGAAPPQLPEVEVAEVIEKAVPVYQEYVATMDGLVNATILAQVEGYLLRQNYKEGSYVKKGQLLFEIDPRPFEAELDVAKAILARHQAVLRTNKATLDRILPLAEANAVSQRDKDDAIGRVQAAEAEVLAARAEVRKAKLDLSFTKIKAPIDGIGGVGWFLATYAGPVVSLLRSPFDRRTNIALGVAYLTVLLVLSWVSAQSARVETLSAGGEQGMIIGILRDLVQPFRW